MLMISIAGGHQVSKNVDTGK